MPTPKKRYTYTFFYNDGSYMTFELTKEDFNSLETALCRGEELQYVATSIGIIGLSNIKAVILQKDEEEEDEINTSQTLPPLDQESYNWIKEQIGGF